MKKRCEWCGTDPLYVKYHDDEWGVPLHDDKGLFELLILEGAQAGLSWLTILRKPTTAMRSMDLICRRLRAIRQGMFNACLQTPASYGIA